MAGLIARWTMGITVSFFATAALAGEVKPMETMLRSRAASAGRVVIEVCELGSCRDVGRHNGYDDGYTLEQWREIQEICRDEGRYLQLKNVVGQIFGFIGVRAIWSLHAAGLTVVAIQLLTMENVDAESKIRVGDTLGGVLAEDQTFVLSVRDFIGLIDGIDDCAKTWTEYQHPIYKRYNNGWARPLG